MKILVLLLLLPSFAHAVNAPYIPTSTKDCLENKKLQPLIPNPNLTEDVIREACQVNDSAPIDQGRCAKTLSDSQKSFDDYVAKLKSACLLVDKYKKFEPCMQQKTCLNEYVALNKESMQVIDGILAQIKDLVKKLDAAREASRNKIEEIASSIAKIEPEAKRIQGYQQGSTPAPGTALEEAEKLGGTQTTGVSTVESAYFEQNNGMSAAAIQQILQNTQSSISDSSLDNTQSPIVGEQLYAAYMAEVTKHNLEAEYERLTGQKSALQNTVDISTNNEKNLGAVGNKASPTGSNPNQPAGAFNPAALSGLAGLAGAGSNPISPQQYYVPQRISESEAYSDAISAASKKGTDTGSNKPQVDAKISAEASEALGAKTISSGRSKLGNSKFLTGKGASGTLGTAASPSVIGAESSALKNNLDSKKAGSPSKGSGHGDDLLAGFGGGNLSGGMGLSGSETDSFIQDVVMDLIGGDSPKAQRSPASEKASSAKDIGEENGPSLFLRMNEMYKKCLKKSCVAASMREKI